MDNFKFIFLHLVKNGQQEDLHTASEFLKVGLFMIFVGGGGEIFS